jgi:hypothetical protein
MELRCPTLGTRSLTLETRRLTIELSKLTIETRRPTLCRVALHGVSILALKP